MKEIGVARTRPVRTRNKNTYEKSDDGVCHLSDMLRKGACTLYRHNVSELSLYLKSNGLHNVRSEYSFLNASCRA